MENKSSICNIVPSPYDERDWIFEAKVCTSIDDVPQTFKCKNILPVKNQGKRGTCVAMTLSCVKEYQEATEHSAMKGVKMSPNSLYIYRKPSSGMYCRNAMKLLQEKGMCTEKKFPYSKTTEPTKIPDAAVKEALNFRIKSYARIETVAGTKRALMESGPLLIAFPYYKNGKPQFWRKPNMSSKADGGHAVTIIGWTKDGFIIRNSWGKSWNGDGHVMYPYSDWGMHWEIWASIDSESDVIPDVVPDPESDPNKLIIKLLNLCGKK